MRMRKRALSDLILVAAFAAICLGGLGYLAEGMGMPLPFLQQGSILRADFAHAEGIVPQSDVYISGVHVGKVLGLRADGTGALVTMRIDPGITLRQDVQAFVEPKTAIGDTYISLARKPGSTAPPVASGYTIPRARTGQSVQLDQILNTMSPATRTAMSQSLRQLGAGVAGRTADIHATIPQLDQVLANLQPIVQVASTRQHDINQILVSLAVIMRSLAQEQQSLGQLVSNGNTAIGAVASRDGDLAGTVRQADQLLGSLQGILHGLTAADRASLRQSPATLRTTLKLLAQLNPVIDRLLPEILLAQVNYPNNQNSVASTGSETVAQEWISAFSQHDGRGNALRITPVINPANLTQLPISLGGATAAGSGGTPPLPAIPQLPSKDASGQLIPSVVQMLLGLPS